MFVDAKRIAKRVFGDHLLGNVVLVGAAFQLGGLPVSAEDLDAAASRLGETSREAVAWGRWATHDPEAVETAIGKPPDGGPFEPSEKARAMADGISVPDNLPANLRRLVARRTAQVADYQDARLAARYADLVTRAAARDSREGAAGDWALTRAVADAWFKLLTYKDEYEVARLHLAAD